MPWFRFILAFCWRLHCTSTLDKFSLDQYNICVIFLSSTGEREREVWPPNEDQRISRSDGVPNTNPDPGIQSKSENGVSSHLDCLLCVLWWSVPVFEIWDIITFLDINYKFVWYFLCSQCLRAVIIGVTSLMCANNKWWCNRF